MRVLYKSQKGLASLKKLVKAERSAILVVDVNTNSVVAKLPRNGDVSKYNRFMYMFYYIGKEIQ